MEEEEEQEEEEEECFSHQTSSQFLIKAELCLLCDSGGWLDDENPGESFLISSSFLSQ